LGDVIEQAVERVITTMRDNLGEPLTVDDMARAAMFSKFHFTRIFQRVTGVSPGRFLSALRLQQAKHLLVSTSFNVADISVRVGYNSVGTFSSRFTRSVGLSPTTYRRLGGFTQSIPTDTTEHATGVVSGRICTRPTNAPQPVFVGLFPSRIPEGRPARCAIVGGPGRYVLDKVPDGVWYVLSQSVTDTLAGGHALSVASYGPIEIQPNTIIKTADLQHRPMRFLDPPVLLALLDMRAACPHPITTDQPNEWQPAA
jgi:AraC-like DNA-binding protein